MRLAGKVVQSQERPPEGPFKERRPMVDLQVDIPFAVELTQIRQNFVHYVVINSVRPSVLRFDGALILLLELMPRRCTLR